MHDAAYEWVLRNAPLEPVAVLDLGGRNVNGSIRPVFAEGSSFVSVDLVAGPDVDVVGDAADVSVAGRFDVVVSTELLEHTPRGAEIVANAAAHLSPGGVFIATMAGPGRAVHSADGAPELAPGEWYANVEPDELGEWLDAAGFSEWKVDQAGEDVRCVAWR